MSTMSVLIPVAINDSSLVSSTVVENDYAAWASGVSYVSGNRVIVTTPNIHKVYQCVSNHTSSAATHPVTGTDLSKWVMIGPTNRWAMFDSAVGTATTSTTSITVVLKPGKVISGIVVMSTNAATWSYSITDNGGSGPNTVAASGNFSTYDVDDWYEYMAAPIQYSRDLVLTGLPLFTDPQITITLSVPSGTISVGLLIVGGLVSIGSPQYGLTLGMIDYSRKETDDFGVTTLVQRSFSRKAEVPVICDQSALNSVYGLMTNLRATPAVWIPLTDSGFESTMIYGWFRDFTIDIALPGKFYCTIQLEGLT